MRHSIIFELEEQFTEIWKVHFIWCIVASVHINQNSGPDRQGIVGIFRSYASFSQTVISAPSHVECVRRTRETKAGSRIFLHSDRCVKLLEVTKAKRFHLTRNCHHNVSATYKKKNPAQVFCNEWSGRRCSYAVFPRKTCIINKHVWRERAAAVKSLPNTPSLSSIAGDPSVGFSLTPNVLTWLLSM